MAINEIVEVENNNVRTFETAMKLISGNKSLPDEIKNEFSIFELISSNNKLEEMDGETLKPELIFYNNELFKDEMNNQIEEGIKTYILAKMEDGTYKMFNGFSVTLRIKMELLQGIFKNNLPKILVRKVSRGMKQEYTIKPIKE